MTMEQDSKIFVAGHKGLVGSTILCELEKQGYTNCITRSKNELDLMIQSDVYDFFSKEKPDYVFLAAAKVGGIHANATYPAEFIHNNLAIQNNVIDAAYQNGVKKLVFLGSNCIYPKHAKQPVKEEYLLTGSLEPTNEAYAIAKIAGISMCASYKKQYGFNAISVMPTNLYGPGDSFDLENSHVIPALLQKFHTAKKNDAAVTIWGTGSAKREFLYVDDMAKATIFAMQNYEAIEPINIGTGQDISIKDLVTLICPLVGFEGECIWDTSKPDGMPRKLLDVSRMTELGWTASTPLQAGLKQTYEWFKKQLN